MAHRYVKLTGRLLGQGNQADFTIECACGHVSRGLTFAAAADDFEAHKAHKDKAPREVA